MQPEQHYNYNAFERFSIRATKWIGSSASLVIHTLLFIGAFLLRFLGIPLDEILLVLTTIVSLEAIYLSIFIQMTVNRQAKALKDVSQDIEEIQEDVEEIQEDVEGIEKDVDEVQKDIEEIQEDVEDIGEDVEEINEEESEDVRYRRIEETLALLAKEISELHKKK